MSCLILVSAVSNSSRLSLSFTETSPIDPRPADLTPRPAPLRGIASYERRVAHLGDRCGLFRTFTCRNISMYRRHRGGAGEPPRGCPAPSVERSRPYALPANLPPPSASRSRSFDSGGTQWISRPTNSTLSQPALRQFAPAPERSTPTKRHNADRWSNCILLRLSARPEFQILQHRNDKRIQS
jgi:hypothetical protein